MRYIKDIGQMGITSTVGSMSTKFDMIKFREFITSTMVMHNLPFMFIEYLGIKVVFNICDLDTVDH